MTERLRDAAFELAVRLREGQQDVRAELAELERALSGAAIEREQLDDLPRMVELEKQTDKKHDDPACEWVTGWNEAIDHVAALVRYQLQRIERGLW